MRLIRKEDRRIKYDREHTVMITLKLNKKTDEDIIRFLDSLAPGTRSLFLKKLLREKMPEALVSNTDI